MMKRFLPVLGLLLASAAAGAAQDVPFETVGQGVMGRFGPARDQAIRTQAELTSSGVQLAPGASVDFTREMVVSCEMGTRNTGGYGITITGITRRQLSPGQFELQVEVARRSPAPGSMVTMALTAPFHVVKLQRYAQDRVTFVDSLPAFDSVDRSISSLPRAKSVSIGKDGKVSILSGMAGHLPSRKEGTATRAELDALAAALRAADFKSIPATLPQPNPAPLGGANLYLKVTGGAQAGETRGLMSFLGAYQARINGINAAIDAIVDRIEATPVPGAFDIVRYDLSPGFPHGQASTSLWVFHDGKVTVQRSQPNALIAPIDGTATAAELAALEAAVRGARLASIPTQLQVPVHIVAGDTFTLEVGSQTAALSGSTRGEPGYLQQYEARLRPLLDACEAIADRVGTPAPQVEEAKGVVRVLGGVTFLIESPSTRYRLRGPVVAQVREFLGRTVKVEGKAGASVGSSPATVTFEATKIVRPLQVTDELTHAIPVGASTLHVYVRNSEVRLFGPAARVVTRLGRGKAVKTDGFLFLGGPQAATPEELYVAAVAAKVTAFSTLTRQDGGWGGVVRKDQAVEVRYLSSNGASAFVRAGNRSGWMPTRRLELEEIPLPLHTPSTGPGLSGSLPGN